jgi:hypothetical protein
LLDEKNCLTDDFLEKANDQSCFEYQAVEILLKGVEIPLTQGIVFTDKSGIERKAIRIKWWLENATTYKEYALGQNEIIEMLPDLHVEQKLIKQYYYSKTEKPLFIGHYCLTGECKLQASNVVCLDYSVGNSENQVAYRWNKGERALTHNNFVHSLEKNKDVS